MKQFLLLTAGLAIFCVHCGSQATDADPAASESQTVTISWTVPGQAAGQAAIQSRQITKAQSEWLRGARARARARFFAGAPAMVETPPPAVTSDGVGVVTSALTTGSNQWSDCQNLDWFYMTSGLNDTGNMFCAKFSSTTGFSALLIDHGNEFAPQYVDPAYASNAFFNLCHNGESCVLTQCCENGSCSGIWRSFFKNSAGGNVSAPSDVIVIAARCSPTPADPSGLESSLQLAGCSACVAGRAPLACWA